MNAPAIAPHDERSLDCRRETARRDLGHHQANQIEVEQHVDAPPDQRAGTGSDHAGRGRRNAAPATQLQHERKPHQRNAHQRGHARGATAERCRPGQPTPPLAAVTRGGARGDTEVGGGRLGAHRRAEADGGDDGDRSQRRQPPRKSFLLTRTGDHIGGQVGAGHVQFGNDRHGPGPRRGRSLRGSRCTPSP